MKRRLLIATHNKGKVAEYARLLSDINLAWIGLNDLGVSTDVAETGNTFAENAILKARGYAAETGLLTLADDSGLRVDALDGQPGVYTARYGGTALTRTERYLLLLKNMQGVPWERRTARFMAVIAVSDGDGRLLGTSEGVCEGVIATEPAGEGGFGYDPVFFLPHLGKTMAQLDPVEKHRISHRGNAIRDIIPLLREILSSGSYR